MITVLKAKISYGKLTHTELLYEGSITLDEDVMDAVGIRDNEQVHVVNLNNGERLITYAIAGARGSGVFGLNGPAARLGMVGDEIHVLAYATQPDTDPIAPKIVDFRFFKKEVTR
ncbi:MAG: aspartate 1-decarboxylase [Candidatus Margulisiibacteriota bacterium]